MLRSPALSSHLRRRLQSSGMGAFEAIKKSHLAKQATNGRSACDYRLDFVRMVLYWQQCACLMPLRHKSFRREKAHIVFC